MLSVAPAERHELAKNRPAPERDDGGNADAPVAPAAAHRCLLRRMVLIMIADSAASGCDTLPKLAEPFETMGLETCKVIAMSR